MHPYGVLTLIARGGGGGGSERPTTNFVAYAASRSATPLHTFFSSSEVLRRMFWTPSFEYRIFRYEVTLPVLTRSHLPEK